jgi:hypothetical protein
LLVAVPVTTGGRPPAETERMRRPSDAGGPLRRCAACPAKPGRLTIAARGFERLP